MAAPKTQAFLGDAPPLKKGKTKNAPPTKAISADAPPTEAVSKDVPPFKSLPAGAVAPAKSPTPDFIVAKAFPSSHAFHGRLVPLHPNVEFKFKGSNVCIYEGMEREVTLYNREYFIVVPGSG